MEFIIACSLYVDCVRSESLQNSFNFEFSVLLIYSLMSYGNSQGHPLDFSCFYPIVIQRVWNSMAPFVRDDCAFYIRSGDFSKKIFCFLKHSFHWSSLGNFRRIKTVPYAPRDVFGAKLLTNDRLTFIFTCAVTQSSCSSEISHLL